jgi:aspartyl-tRNA(Asn)/glutamyl-tRNA(Gln) amidotransferase subunit A
VPDIVAHVQASLDRIDDLDSTINAFVTVDREGALRAAKHVDPKALLAGLTIGVKDNLDVAGLPCSYGSELFADRVAAQDGTAIAQLRAGGAVIIGKTMLTELACGTTGTATPRGDTINPWAHDRMTGGSSSGSAAAVASGMVDAAIGSDTSCSIRLPAAHCGIVGLKPTYDRISRLGLSVCASSLDHIGPLARSVATVAQMLKVMQGAGHDDPTTRVSDPIDGVRVGVLQGEFLDECEPDIRTRFNTAIELLRSLGAEITQLDLGEVLGCDVMSIENEMTALTAEMLDHYGERLNQFEQQGGKISPSLRHWFNIYETITPADRSRALDRQAELRDQVAAVMESAGIDVLACPTVRVTAGLRAGASEADRGPRVLNCTLFDVTGQPSLTVPCGFDRAGLPIGLLLTGRVNADAMVLQVGHAYKGALTTAP